MALRWLVLHLGQTRPGRGQGTPAISSMLPADDIAPAHCSMGTDLRLRKVVGRSIPTRDELDRMIDPCIHFELFLCVVVGVAH